MKLAILFWFYKEPEICLNRLELIKKHNPKLKIFGLFGGKRNEAKLYKNKLGKYLDNLYVSPYCSLKPKWKWLNGDLMILDWYQRRGQSLKDWDSVVITQWDALVLGNINKQFPGIKRDEVFISGSRVLDKNIEKRWHWTKPGGKERKNYLDFSRYILEKYNYKKKLLCSLFILQVFPRRFFDKWLSIENKEIGMLEYKLPTYTKIFGFPLYKKNLGVWWFNNKAYEGRTPLNAREIEIKKDFIEAELNRKNGYRIFHPYFKVWK